MMEQQIISGSSQLLVEKYRPKIFEDLIGNPAIVAQIKQYVADKNIPHLLLAGPAGTGKTSLVGVIKHALYGSNKKSYRELNASDQNGIDDVRTTVKEFASHSCAQEDIAFRVLILEEADEMTAKAQAALRRIMEQYSSQCRFILTCNSINKIIKPIQSRCSTFELEQIKPSEMKPRLQFICMKEQIQMPDEVLDFIMQKSKGDMRTAINSFIEKCKGMPVISIQALSNIAVDDSSILQLLKFGLNGKFINARQCANNIIQKGTNIRALIQQCVDSIYDAKEWEKIPNQMKGDIAEMHMKHEMGLLTGVAEQIVLLSFIAELSTIATKYRPKKAE